MQACQNRYDCYGRTTFYAEIVQFPGNETKVNLLHKRTCVLRFVQLLYCQPANLQGTVTPVRRTDSPGSDPDRRFSD